mgnify:CR=1 FL=1
MTDDELKVILFALANLAYNELSRIERGRPIHLHTVQTIINLYSRLHKDSICPYSPTISSLQHLLRQPAQSTDTPQELPST